jgi:hypothetical protein
MHFCLGKLKENKLVPQVVSNYRNDRVSRSFRGYYRVNGSFALCWYCNIGLCREYWKY